jgi:hypothetical protein
MNNEGERMFNFQCSMFNEENIEGMGAAGSNLMCK